MKRFFRLALILALALALALTLFAGCSDKSNAPEGTDPPNVTASGSAETLGQLTFASQYFMPPDTLPVPRIKSANRYVADSSAITPDALYYTDGNALYCADKSDFQARQIDNYVPLDGYTALVLGTAFGDDILVLESDGTSSVVSRLDEYGLVQGVTDVTDSAKLYGGGEIVKLFADKSETLYILTEQSETLSVLIIAPDGTARSPATSAQILNCVLSGDGTAYVLLHEMGYAGNTLYPLSGDGTLGTLLCELAQEAIVHSGGGAFGLIYNDFYNINAVDTVTGNSANLFGTLDHAITDIYVPNIWCSERNLIIRDTNNGLYLFEESDEAPKTILRMASYDAFLMNYMVGEFNASSDKYKIIVDDYVYIEGGLQKLNTEILAGNIPDMIDFSAIGLEGYDDFMIDLYPLMDADPDFDRSDPMESVLNDFEIDGELYAAPSSFSINGFVGLAALVGEESGWTLDEMLAIEERYAPDAAPLGGLSRAYALEFWLSAIADSFIDWDTGKCAFDSDEFLRILEYIKTIPENSAEYTINDLFGGELAFFPINYMLSYTELQTLDVLFGDNAYTFKGYPTRSGDGGLSRKYYLFPAPGISSTCSDVDGAWSFIKFMYNEYEGLTSGYQVSKRSRDKLIRQTREEQTFTELDENGNEVLVPRTPGMGSFLGLPGELEDVLLYPVSDEQAERLDAVADSCDLTVNPDSAVMGIINEELPAFFAGDKSSADTAKIIQSRVQIYVSEQM